MLLLILFLSSIIQNTAIMIMTGTIHSSLVSIATLVKGNLDERSLINILKNISLDTLKDYLECRKIYKGASSKRKQIL